MFHPLRVDEGSQSLVLEHTAQIPSDNLSCNCRGWNTKDTNITSSKVI